MKTLQERLEEDIYRQAEHDNLKFRLWLGCTTIHSVAIKKLVGYHMPEHVKDFCREIWASGESPLQRYERLKNV